MKLESDVAKLDELKRLLRRLDKALPQALSDEAQALGVRSRGARGSAGQRSDTTVRRTIVLAGAVSLVVSLSVALLLFQDTPVRRFIAEQAPPKSDVRRAPAQADVSSPGDQPPQFISETVLLKAEKQPQLQTGPLVARKASGEVAAEDDLLPNAASASASPMETGGVAEAASTAVAALDATAKPVESPPATRFPARPAEKPNINIQPDTNRGALVELDPEQFMRRGLLMLSRGSISAAQLLLERAADLGSGDAAFALASTYDGAPGAPRHGPEVRPNGGLALRWYARAQELGIAKASKRLAELKSGDDASRR